MSTSNQIMSYFPLKHQYHLLDVLIKYELKLNNLVNIYSERYPSKTHAKTIYQHMLYIIIINCFGLIKNHVISFINDLTQGNLKKYFNQINPKLKQSTWFFNNINIIEVRMKTELEFISSNILDDYYELIGNHARILHKDACINNNQKIFPNFELFIGLIKPSQIFPNYNVHSRGKIMPFFNLRLYQHIYNISSKKELIALLKTPEQTENGLEFRFAGRIGFIRGPPGKNPVYTILNDIEASFENLDLILTNNLVQNHLLDLSVVSVDCTNISIDKRDKYASKGMGSKGKFRGYKASISCDKNCVPISLVVDQGKQADINLYRDTISQVEDIANRNNKNILVQTADAGYSSTDLMDDIAIMESIPWIDLNSRNSTYLKELKTASSDLYEISRKAINKGLNMDDRKKWIKDLKNFCQKKPEPRLIEKEKELLKILRKYAAKARYNGLNETEKRKETRLRKKVNDCRANVRKYAGKYSKQLGLTIVGFGTIEWLLVYAIRGKNEGINGILKKKGNLLGDGQKTPWIYGINNIYNRIFSTIVLIKYMIFANYVITGKKTNGMRFVYNWDTISVLCTSF